MKIAFASQHVGHAHARHSKRISTAFHTQLTGTNCGHNIVKRTRFQLKKWLPKR
jgi:hypothetical protein